VLRVVQHGAFVLHMVVVQDFVQMLLIKVAVVEGECHTLGTKASSSSDSMQVGRCVATFAVKVLRHIKVDDNLNVRNV